MITNVKILSLLYSLLLQGSCAIIFCLSPLYGQTTSSDSLKNALKNARHDTTRVTYCNALGEAIFFKKPEEALVYFQKAQAICKHNLKTCPSDRIEYKTFKSQMAFAINNIGFCAKMKGQIFKALEAYNASLKIQEEIGNKEGIATALINLGVIYNDQGNIPKALEYFDRSLKLHEATNNKKGIATSLDDIGVIYSRQGDLSTALMYYTKALKIREELGEKDGLASSLNNIGVVYRNQHKAEKAIEFYTRSLNIMNEIGDKQGAATCLNNIGSVYKNEAERLGQGEEQYNKALEYYLRGLKIREEINDKKGVSVSLHNIGAVYLKEKEYKKAIDHGLRSLKIAQDLGYPVDIRNSAKLLAECYKKVRDHKQLLKYLELHEIMRDSINNQTTKKASLKTVLKYEYEKQAAADSVLHAKETEIKNAELAGQEAEIRTKRNQQYAMFGGFGLICLFSLFMLNRWRVTQKQKVLIEHQKKIVEEQKILVEEKQKEVLDSIHYARRIQMAQIPSEKRVYLHLQKTKSHN